MTGSASPFGSLRSSRPGKGLRELFVTRVPKGTTEKDFLDFILRFVRPVDFLRVSHPMTNHQSFIFSVPDFDVSSIMQPDIWPVGIQCRYFKRPISGWLAHGLDGHRQPVEPGSANHRGGA